MSKSEIKRAVKITAAALHPAEYARTVYMVRVENHVLVADLLKPAFWTHVAAQLKKLDRVEVVPEDGSWYAEFMVLSVSANTARVVPLRVIQVDGTPISAIEDYYVKWGNAGTKFRVHRKADKAIMASGFDTSEDAQAHIEKLLENQEEKVA